MHRDYALHRRAWVHKVHKVRKVRKVRTDTRNTGFLYTKKPLHSVPLHMGNGNV